MPQTMRHKIGLVKICAVCQKHEAPYEIGGINCCDGCYDTINEFLFMMLLADIIQTVFTKAAKGEMIEYSDVESTITHTSGVNLGAYL